MRFNYITVSQVSSLWRKGKQGGGEGVRGGGQGWLKLEVPEHGKPAAKC